MTAAAAAAPAAATTASSSAAGSSAPLPASAEARLAAFCSPSSPEVFDSIVYQQQIWTADPFDVGPIHNEAREAFDRLLRRAAADPPPPHGKVLLLHGESGSGKTHLMRAFRHVAHADVAGYFCYMQMTTEAGNYGRYLLRNLVASLDQPFLPPAVETSGLMRLSTGVLEAVPGLSDAELDGFRDGTAPGDPAELAFAYADRAVADPRLADCDIDLMRALIHLQRGDPRVKARVIKWLRCEDLPPADREALGGLVPRTQEEDPARVVEDVGRLMARLYAAPLVVCVDQLEDVFQQEQGPDRFRRVVETVITLADRVPTSVTVVACLEDYYKANREHLARPKIDRLERDPEPVRLASGRDPDEVEELVARRLEHLYAKQGVEPDPSDPTFPFRREQLHHLVGFRTRDVLEACRAHHNQCIAAGRWADPPWGKGTGGEKPGGGVGVVEPPRPTPQPDTSRFEQAWNDFRDKFAAEVPDDESKLAGVLTSAVELCNAELPPGCRFAARRADGRLVAVDGPGKSAGSSGERLLVAVSEKSPKGGGLGHQVTEAERRASNSPIVLVRSTSFPTSPKADVVKQIARVISRGGRRVVVENADWRSMLAFQAFRQARGSDAGFDAWQRASRPLSQLPALRRILDLDNLPAAQPAAAQPEPAKAAAAPAQAPTKPVTPPPLPKAGADDGRTPAGPLLLGYAKGLTAGAVTLDPAELKQHVAFLGGPGSGKTTAALSLIEQLLLRGTPAVLLDRKGDLSRYADPDAYRPSTGDATLFDGSHGERLRRLRDAVDVRLYTPGSTEGRPLAIPVVPEGLGQLTTADREQTAGFAAAALGGMMGYKPRGADQVLQAILAKAIEVLAQAAPGRPVAVEALQQLVQDQDPALLNAVGGYEPKHYKKLAQDLLTLRLQNGRLLAAGGDPLDVDALLGRGAAAAKGKARLTIVNTQFLGSPAAVDFWVAQFLMALDRWRAKSPSPDLQAVVLLDEADQYLPAVRQPATKAPLESLLRRARSAGLGIMLSTQSPGDFDYRCRENVRAWVVGRVKEQVGLNKLKPMFADARLDAAARLPGQETGEFHLLREGKVVALKAERSLVETRQVPEQGVLQLARGQV